eukprot:GHVU01233661.1.p1 GENE.GHVU01233661.1~~GHVU01233661.1.p1  ORF type:complete len:633 (+),score=122.24 GHVU01233661.1:343-2241(+)
MAEPEAVVDVDEATNIDLGGDAFGGGGFGSDDEGAELDKIQFDLSVQKPEEDTVNALGRLIWWCSTARGPRVNIKLQIATNEAFLVHAESLVLYFTRRIDLATHFSTKSQCVEVIYQVERFLANLTEGTGGCIVVFFECCKPMFEAIPAACWAVRQALLLHCKRQGIAHKTFVDWFPKKEPPCPAGASTMSTTTGGWSASPSPLSSEFAQFVHETHPPYIIVEDGGSLRDASVFRDLKFTQKLPGRVAAAKEFSPSSGRGGLAAAETIALTASDLSIVLPLSLMLTAHSLNMHVATLYRHAKQLSQLQFDTYPPSVGDFKFVAEVCSLIRNPVDRAMKGLDPTPEKREGGEDEDEEEPEDTGEELFEEVLALLKEGRKSTFYSKAPLTIRDFVAIAYVKGTMANLGADEDEENAELDEEAAQEKEDKDNLRQWVAYVFKLLLICDLVQDVLPLNHRNLENPFKALHSGVAWRETGRPRWDISKECFFSEASRALSHMAARFDADGDIREWASPARVADLFDVHLLSCVSGFVVQCALTKSECTLGSLGLPPAIAEAATAKLNYCVKAAGLKGEGGGGGSGSEGFFPISPPAELMNRLRADEAAAAADGADGAAAGAAAAGGGGRGGGRGDGT